MLDQYPTADRTTQQLLQQFQQQYLQQQLQKQHRSGARLFYWIAAMSIVNTVIILRDSDQTFSVGLVVTQLIDYMGSMLRAHISTSATLIAIITLSLDTVIAITMAAFGWFAVRGQRWALILGMIMYTLDGGIFLLVGDWVAVMFRASLLWMIYRSLQACTRLQATNVRGGASVYA